MALRTFVPEFQRLARRRGRRRVHGRLQHDLRGARARDSAVCVPRTAPRREQLIRARALGALGLLQVVEPDRLDGSTLRGEIEVALTRSRSALARAARKALRFDGATTSAGLLLEEAALSGLRRAA